MAGLLFRTKMALGTLVALGCSIEASAYQNVVLGSVPLSENRNLTFGRPTPRDSAVPEVLVSRPSYVLSWNPTRRVANWVAWELRREDLQGVNQRKNFRTDPDLVNYQRGNNPGWRAVSPAEYLDTCFDRGHQVASADRTDSAPEPRSTYYMSNVLPQTAWLNRIEWRNLEYFERRVVREMGKRLVVFSGGIFGSEPSAIGPRKDIAVPTHNFKIIVALDEGQSLMDAGRTAPMLVLKFPNLNSDGSDPLRHRERTCLDHASQWDRAPEEWPESDSWLEYQTSLDELENDTGFDFFTTSAWNKQFQAWQFPRP